MRPSIQQTPPEDEFDFDEDDSSFEDDATKAKRYAADLEEQFAIFPMAIVADERAKKLTPRDVCLYLYLLSKEGRNKHSFWGIGGLSLLTGTAASTVKESLRRLTKCGHIRRVPRGTTSTKTVCLTKMVRTGGVSRLYIRGKAVGASNRQGPSLTTASVTRRRQVTDEQTLSEDYFDREDTKAFIREADEFFAS